MKRKVGLAAAAALLLASGALSAQVIERMWAKGTVIGITKVDVKPGQERAYARYLVQNVLPRIEYGKRAGDIVSYRVFRVMDRRDEEPDLLIMTEFKDYSHRNRPDEWFDEMDRKLAGSAEGRRQQVTQMRELADPKGNMLLEEMVLKR